MIKNVMAMCDKSGRFLFEVLPDLFPHGRITPDEMLLWELYYTEKKEQMDRR